MAPKSLMDYMKAMKQSAPKDAGSKVLVGAVAGPEETCVAEKTEEKPYQCIKCCDFFAEGDGFFTGRPDQRKTKKGPFKCSGCNRLEGRLRTIRNNNKDMEDGLANLTKEQVAEFMKAKKELVGSDLADALKLYIENITENTTKDSSGSAGQFFPEEYCKNTIGFGEDIIKNFKANADVKWDHVLKCKTY